MSFSTPKIWSDPPDLLFGILSKRSLGAISVPEQVLFRGTEKEQAKGDGECDATKRFGPSQPGSVHDPSQFGSIHDRSLPSITSRKGPKHTRIKWSDHGEEQHKGQQRRQKDVAFSDPMGNKP